MKALKLAAIATVATLTLAGCSDEQSVFDVNAVPGRCTIEGQITYNEGTTLNSETGKFEYKFKPLADTQVKVRVANSAYNNGQTGYTYFTTTTDSEGNYAITVPAPENTVYGTVLVPDFKGTRSVVKKVNNKVDTKVENVIYYGDHQVKVTAGHIEYANFRCTECGTEQTLNVYDKAATLKIRLGKGTEYTTPYKAVYSKFTDQETDEQTEVFSYYQNGNLYYCYEPASKADVILTVTQNGDTMTFNTTTDDNGEFSIDVPVIGFPTSFNYEVQVMPWDAEYTHYVDETLWYIQEKGKFYSTQEEAQDAYQAIMDKYYAALEENPETEMPNVRSPRSFVQYVKAEKKIKGYFTQSLGVSGTANYPVASNVYTDLYGFCMVFNPFTNVATDDRFGYTNSAFLNSNAKIWLSELIENLTNAENK